MIIPTFTYCGFHLLDMTETQLKKLNSFHQRAEQIVNANLQSIINANKKRASIFVKSCLENDVIEPFKNYFELSSHCRNTRNNEKIIRLPKLKTKYARKAFYFTGAKLYNSLPLEARSLCSRNFKVFISEYYR